MPGPRVANPELPAGFETEVLSQLGSVAGFRGDLLAREDQGGEAIRTITLFEFLVAVRRSRARSTSVST